MGGSSPRNTTTTQITEYPPWMQEAMQGNLARANNLADQFDDQGYQGYNAGDRIAGMNSMQMNALGNVRDSVGNWTPLMQRGIDASGQANALASQVAQTPLASYTAQSAFAGPSALVQAQGAGPAAMIDANSVMAGNPGAQYANAAQAGPAQNVQAGNLPGTDLSGYMNPYADLVTRNALGNLEEARQVQGLNNADAAAKAKAFGGSRHGVVDAQTNAAFAKQAGELSLNAAQSNFLNAQNMATQDLGRDLQAQGMNQSANNNMGQFNAGLEQQANQLNAQLGTNAGMQGYGYGLQALLANQGSANNMAQFNAGQNMQGQLANQSGYNNMAQYNAGLAQQANMQNSSQGLQADLAMRGIGLDAANQLRSGAGMDSSLASMYQGMNSNDLNNLFNAGAMMQDNEQLYRDFNYQEFLNQQNFPIDTLNLRYGAVTNTPYTGGSTTSSPIYRNRAAGFLGGAATGASAGSSFGPWGAAIGGLLGGAAGGYG